MVVWKCSSSGSCGLEHTQTLLVIKDMTIITLFTLTHHARKLASPYNMGIIKQTASNMFPVLLSTASQRNAHPSGSLPLCLPLFSHSVSVFSCVPFETLSEGPSVEVKRCASERMLASVCLRCARGTSRTSLRRACPWDGGKRGKLEKGRECEDEMKGKIHSYAKEREREERIWKERDI